MSHLQPVDIARGRVRRQGWTRLGRGIYVASRRRDQRLSVLRAWQQAVGQATYIGGLDAAEVRGWALPLGVEQREIEVVQPRNVPRVRRPGVRVFRTTGEMESEALFGLRVVDPVTTLRMCARRLAFLDLLVLVDSALSSGTIDEDSLESVLGRRLQGTPALRQVLPWADAAAESAGETMLRTLLVSAGCAVDSQAPLVDDSGDEWGRADLLLRGTRVVMEYDGAVHRSPTQHAKDLRRQRRLTAAGYMRHGYVLADLLQRPGHVIRDAERLGIPISDPEGRRWVGWVRESTYSAYGRSQLAMCLGAARPSAA